MVKGVHKMKIVSLVENTCFSGKYDVEHGLSLYIEVGNKKILFDMGQTDLFVKNAKELGVDLSDIDVAILSHGHYDHGGGLGKFLEINQKAPVYLSRYAFGKYYNGNSKYIGLDMDLNENPRLVFVDEFNEIDEGLTLFSCNDNDREFNLGSFGLTMAKNGKIVDDDFCHEQYLLIEEQGKKVLISGCSHKGVLNITNWFVPDVLIGGFHFSKLPLDDKLAEYADYLNKFKTVFYTCHCTGVEQYEFMKKYMENLNYISTGDSVEI